MTKTIEPESLYQLTSADIGTQVIFNVRGYAYEGKIQRISFGTVLWFLTIENRQVKYEFTFEPNSDALVEFRRFKY